MVASLKRTAWVALLVALAPLEAQPAADFPPPIDRFVVFGDSLSDPGNTFVATGEFEVRPFDPIPAAPYLIGRFHFSNGPTWVEQLGRSLGLARSVRPALLRPGVYTNYAFGSGRARPPAGPVAPFDPTVLSGQIGLFLSDFDGVAAPEALYVLWIGANDLRDAFAALEQDPSGGTSNQIIAAAIGATAAGIQRLWDAGARSLLVPNMPNIGATPALRALGPEAEGAGELLSVGYNAGLEATLDQLENLPGIVILRLDVFVILEEVVMDPDLAGLKNVTDSCITPGVIFDAICRSPGRFLFWDFIHPTRSAHEYLSEQAQAALEMEVEVASSAF